MLDVDVLDEWRYLHPGQPEPTHLTSGTFQLRTRWPIDDVDTGKFRRWQLSHPTGSAFFVTVASSQGDVLSLF